MERGVDVKLDWVVEAVEGVNGEWMVSCQGGLSGGSGGY